MRLLIRVAGLTILALLRPATADFIPNDPAFSQQWALSKMHVPAAWDYSLGSPDVKIGVLDTGIIFQTPELQGRYLTPLVADTGAVDTSAAFPHGTWVASTIGMMINNGVAGAGTGNFSILPIRITDATGNASDASILQGVSLAAQNGCRVINISSRVTSYAALNAAVAQALAANQLAGRSDFLVFVSAGNDNTFRTLGSPDLDNAQSRLAGDHLIMVSGTDQNDQHWFADSFTGSDIGPFVDLAAPAQQIYVANGIDPNLPYGLASGTSFSAPFAASAAALAFSINPDLTALQVQNILFDTAYNPDNPNPGSPFWDQTYGWGRVDFGAVAVAANATLAPEPSTLGVSLAAGVLLLRRSRRACAG